MKTYGKEIQEASQAIVNAHKASGLSDEQAKQAAIVTVNLIFTTPKTSTLQKIYNHLTGVQCPYKI